MSEKTKISWVRNTDGTPGHTFNPWVGCAKVGPGCDNCYAESWAKRAGEPGLWQGQRRKTKTWGMPVRWNREAEASGVRARVFCASLADVFDNAVPQEWRDEIWALIEATPHLDWLLVTKRIGNVGAMIPERWCRGMPDNVWLGITVVDQKEADRDIPKLLRVRCRIRFLSVEPQVGMVDLSSWLDICQHDDGAPWMRRNLGRLYGSLDWVISGAESGPHRRPYDLDWARLLRDQCQAAGIAFFLKQVPGDTRKGVIETPELDGRQWLEFPA